MHAFPVFLSLTGRRALVVGGTDQAARKVEMLLSAGAQVSLVAETVTGDVAQLIADGRITWMGGCFSDDELIGMSLVVVASDDEMLQARASQAAQARCIPVNVVDNAALSSCIMPAVVDRGPVTVAISTRGTAPALARKVRAEIERALPAALGRLAMFADIFREQVRRTVREPRARRRFWDRVFDGRIAALALAGDEISARRELIRLLDGARHEGMPTGMVHLVGAGPGDPDLLTLKAHRLLQRADVVVYDRLVSPEVLALARRDAERILVGMRGALPRVPQDEINQRLITLAQAGHTVVRLQGGDPLMFGSGGEEIAALMRAGIAVEVVPGITAALGCAASAGIPLTHRDHAQSCIFVTGRSKDGEIMLDWTSLARPRQTIVLYMGLETLPIVTRQLIRHGLPSATPVALIENGTTEQEQRVVGTLGTIEQQAMRMKLYGPTLCIIGEVIALALSHDREIRFESSASL